MILRSLFAASVTSLVLIAACGGGGRPTNAGQTIETIRADESLTVVERSEQVYSVQLCDPFSSITAAIADLRSTFETQALETDSFEDFPGLFQDLPGPLAEFLDDLHDIDPPDRFRHFHEALIAEAEYEGEKLEAQREGEDAYLSFLQGSEPPPEPEPPADFEEMFVLECLFDGVGTDLSGGTSGFESPDALEDSGGMGDVVTSGGFELVVHTVQDPVTPASVSGEPKPGRRWLAIELSFTNVACETREYAERDYSVELAEKVRYAPGFFELAGSLGSGSLAPGESVRGWVGFAVPASATVVLLIFDPLAHSETKMEIDLP